MQFVSSSSTYFFYLTSVCLLGLGLNFYSFKESLMSTDVVLQQALHLDSPAPGPAECNFRLLGI